MTFLTLNKQDSSSRTNSFTFKVNKISSNIFTRIQNICNVTLIFVSLVSYLDVKALTLELKLPEAKKKKKNALNLHFWSYLLHILGTVIT